MHACICGLHTWIVRYCYCHHIVAPSGDKPLQHSNSAVDCTAFMWGGTGTHIDLGADGADGELVTAGSKTVASQARVGCAGHSLHKSAVTL